MTRFRVMPRGRRRGMTFLLLLWAAAGVAALDHAWPGALVLGAPALLAGLEALRESFGTMAVVLGALGAVKREEEQVREARRPQPASQLKAQPNPVGQASNMKYRTRRDAGE